jgi:hypothetical protein
LHALSLRMSICKIPQDRNRDNYLWHTKNLIPRKMQKASRTVFRPGNCLPKATGDSPALLTVQRQTGRECEVGGFRDELW